IEITGGSNITTTKGVRRSSSAFASTFGTGPLTYSILTSTGAAVQSGITISETGVVTVAETATSETVTIIITVTDSVTAIDTVSLLVIINPPLIISAGSNIVTTFGRADTTSAFTYTGGTAPHTFSISRVGGGSLAGIAIDSVTGVITVAANTVADSYTIRVQIQDSVSAVDSIVMTVRVNPAIVVSGRDTITTTYSIETSTTYSATGGTTQSTGGAGELVFTLLSVVGSRGLDTRTITINPSTGYLFASDTTIADTYTIVVVATDSVGVTGSKTIKLIVNESITIASGGNVTTTFGRVKFSGTFGATFGTGSRTYTIKRTSTGLVYPGITISETGVVRVAETVPVDTYVMTITLTDAVGDSTTISMTVVVNETVTLSGGSNILTTYTRAESSSAFVAARGTTAYTYSIDAISAQNGSATTGITIDSVTGVVRAAGGAASGSGLNAYVYHDPTTGGSPPIPGSLPSSVSLSATTRTLAQNPWVEMASPWTSKLIATTTVANIDYNWGSGNVLGTNKSEDVIIKFEGFITSPTTGSYSFTAEADDGVRLIIDGVLRPKLMTV
ncbi:MAG: hypothetical protein EBY74_06020, partial [Actinobacteria bacterium]|nr:hypothetical protein [Actinomycetota bacterium]